VTQAARPVEARMTNDPHEPLAICPDLDEIVQQIKDLHACRDALRSIEAKQAYDNAVGRLASVRKQIHKLRKWGAERGT